MSFSLPDLPYAYDALGPYMSRETLEYHHDKHHLAYVNNGNAALKGTEWEGKPLEEIVKGSFGKNAAVFNNAGQHYNHIHFWKWMKPNGGGHIPGEVERALKDAFGSVDKAKEDLIQAGVTQFGFGWCWLTLKGGAKTFLFVCVSWGAQMRDLLRALEDLSGDLARTQAEISIMERAIRELATMIDRVESVQKGSLRRRELNWISERLAIARAKQSSIARLMEECGHERDWRGALRDVPSLAANVCADRNRSS